MRRAISKQPAFALRRYPYRSRSCLVDFLTREYGIVRLVASPGRRGAGKARGAPSLGLGLEMLIDWREGRRATGLANLDGVEDSPANDAGQALASRARALMPLSYMSELALRLFKPHDPHPDLYDCYRLVALSLPSQPADCLLRYFEREALAIAGFGAEPAGHDGDDAGDGLRAWAQSCQTVRYSQGQRLARDSGRKGLGRLAEAFGRLSPDERRALRLGLRERIDERIGADALNTRRTMQQMRAFAPDPAPADAANR